MIKVCIQVEAGSCEKRLYNESTVEYKETRRVTRPYPYPYGFILDTCAEDGGSLDCYLITRQRLEPGAIVECEPLGLLEQYEGKEVDHKILAGLPGDEDGVIHPELLQELQEFITALFAVFPDIQVRVGPILSREAALSCIEAGRKAAY